jgi:2-dehydro-3-deoxyphosphogluconate aldolase / (4S)-4-hydroxy-2-oxoglutarate aldolase
VSTAEPIALEFQELLRQTRLVPVITIHDVDAAIGLATALRDGGLPVLEVTLRTEAGLASIERIAKEVPDVVVGAGTVLTPQQYRNAREAGAQFIVSPGCTDQLLRAAVSEGGAFLPGAVTATEVMRMLDVDISLLKFFPAQSSGGVAAVKALGGPFPQVTFCPTGGIDLPRAQEYLALPNVACVGGSWMVPQSLIESADWATITRLASEATTTLRA